MIVTGIVIVASMILAAGFGLAWLLAPGFRRQLEDPKRWFENQVRQYDQACGEPAAREKEYPNESR